MMKSFITITRGGKFQDHELTGNPCVNSYATRKPQCVACILDELVRWVCRCSADHLGDAVHHLGDAVRQVASQVRSRLKGTCARRRPGTNNAMHMNDNDRMHFVLLNRWARKSMSWIDGHGKRCCAARRMG